MCVKCFESEGKLPCDAYQGIVHWAWWSLKDQKPDSSLASRLLASFLRLKAREPKSSECLPCASVSQSAAVPP